MLRLVLLFLVFFAFEPKTLASPSPTTFNAHLPPFGGASPFPFRDVLDQRNILWFQFSNGDYIAIFPLPQSTTDHPYAVAFYDRHLSYKATGLGKVEGLIFSGEYTSTSDHRLREFHIKAFIDDDGDLFFCFQIDGLSYRITLVKSL